MARGDGLLESGVFKQGGAQSPGWFNNIGLKASTTTNTNDSISITSADGNTLTEKNVGYVTLPSTTSGLLTTFRLTSDIKILLTGATWGEGGKGDLTNYMLSVYLLNDSGLLKAGVGSIPNHWVILNADDTATQAGASSAEKILVNSALTSDSSCLEIGWFKANFDDTGGLAEDLWAIQTGIGAINLTKRLPIFQRYTPTFTGFGTVTVQNFKWRRFGDTVEIDGNFTTGTVTGTEARISLPSGLVASSAINTLENAGTFGNNRSSTNEHGGLILREPSVAYFTLSNDLIFGSGAAASIAKVNGDVASPSASGDIISLKCSLPITGWS